MRHKTASDSTTKPDEGSLELTEDIIRVRAYRLYEERGCGHGHDLDDWLQAETKIVGKTPAAATESEATEGTRKAVAA